MKTLSILQPFASLLAEQVKTVELRSWATRYRGELLIRASRNCPVRWEDDNCKRVILPNNCLLFVGHLVDVRPMEPRDCVGAMSSYWNNQFSWTIRFSSYVYPRQASGKLRLYETPDNIIEGLPSEQARQYHPMLKSRTRHPFRGSVVRGELIVRDSRKEEPEIYTLHVSTSPPLGYVFLPMYGYIGGLRGGDVQITLLELAGSINEGICYRNIEDLPTRTC